MRIIRDKFIDFHKSREKSHNINSSNPICYQTQKYLIHHLHRSRTFTTLKPLIKMLPRTITKNPLAFPTMILRAPLTKPISPTTATRTRTMTTQPLSPRRPEYFFLLLFVLFGRCRRRTDGLVWATLLLVDSEVAVVYKFGVWSTQPRAFGKLSGEPLGVLNYLQSTAKFYGAYSVFRFAVGCLVKVLVKGCKETGR